MDKVVFRLRLATTNACFTCEQARRLVAKFDEHCRKSQLSAPNVFFIKQDWKTNRHTLPSKTPTLAKRDASLFFPKRERERERERGDLVYERERERGTPLWSFWRRPGSERYDLVFLLGAPAELVFAAKLAPPLGEPRRAQGEMNE